MSFRPFAMAWLLALLGAAATAHAQEPSATAAADVLFQQARSDMKRGAYAAACPKFAESHRIEASNGALLNLSLCEEKLGLVASAWLHARELAARLSADDKRAAIVERIIGRLSSKVPRLKVRLSAGAPQHTTVSVDGVELGASSIGTALPVDPGTHRLVVLAPGRSDRVEQLEIEESQSVEWVAEPGAAPQTTAPAPPLRTVVSAQEAPHSPPSASPPWLMWSALGIGAAGVATGTVFFVMTWNKRDEADELCPDKTCADSSKLQQVNDVAAEGKTLQSWTIVSLALGAAGLGFGAYLAAQRSASDSRSAVFVRPLPGRSARRAAPSGAAVTWSTVF